MILIFNYSFINKNEVISNVFMKTSDNNNNRLQGFLGLLKGIICKTYKYHYLYTKELYVQRAIVLVEKRRINLE
jgi:hypothetical protein